MDAAFCYLFDASENGSQFRPAHIAIKILAVTLQVDLNGVKHLAHFRKRRLVHESAAYQYGTNALLFRVPGNVGQIFRENRRFIISKGNNRRFVGMCGIDNLGRRRKRNLMIFRRCLRDFPVLTELALERTSGSGQRKCRRLPAGNGKKVSFLSGQYGWIRDGHRQGSSVLL